MANVFFKRGLQANLTREKTPFQDGTFYLTTDTGRLYADVVSGSTSERVLLNRTIEIVDSLSDLTAKSASWTTAQAKLDHKNDIYYVSSIPTGAESTHAGNILAIWDGTNWVQINPDTDTTITDATYRAIVSNNTATISQTISNSNPGLGDTTATFSITGDNGIIISQTQNGTNNTGVTISGSTYNVATSLTGSNEIANITLSSSNTALSASTATFIAGENISFSTTNTGSVDGIVVSAVDTVITSATLSSPANGMVALTINESGQSPTTATLSNLKIMLNDGNYVPLVSNTSGTQGAIYSKNEIDTFMRDLNGMSVKGTIGASGTGTVQALPTTGVSQGDVYIVVTEGYNVSQGATFDSRTPAPATGSARIGDMIIAQGDETNGVIPSSNLSWLFIPSGDDAADGFIYRGATVPEANTIVLKDGNDVAAAGIRLVAGTDMAVTSTSTTAVYNGHEGAGQQLISTINHAAITTTTSTTAVDATGAFVAIKDITVSNGHISNINYGTYTPIEYFLDNIRIANGTRSTTTNPANDVNVVLGLVANGETATTTMTLASNTINLSQGSSTNIVQMDLVWGEF